MADRRELILASTWALEAIGVDEFQAQIKKLNLGAETDYLVPDHLLTARGDLDEASCKEYASMLRDFIERHRFADLLEVPRIRPLVSADSHDDKPARAILSEATGSDLILLDDSSDEIVQDPVQEATTEFWLPSNGALGYFANDCFNVLPRLAEATGTEISVDEAQGVLVFGQTKADVDDALEKLGVLESCLSLVDHPYREIAVIASESDAVTFSLVNYAGQNQAALRRVLAERDSRSNASLYRMLTPALWKFNPDTQSWDQPHNIGDPPRVDVESGDSQDWHGFIFPEIGSGEGFERSTFMNEAETATIGAASEHPFLTASKAQQVDEWVAHGFERQAAEPDTGLVSEASHELVPASRPSRTLSSPSKKPLLRLKTRKVIPTKTPELAAAPSTPVKTGTQDSIHDTVNTKPEEPNGENPGQVQLKHSTESIGISHGIPSSEQCKIELEKDAPERSQSAAENAMEFLLPLCDLQNARSGNVPRVDTPKNVESSPPKGINGQAIQHDSPQTCSKIVEIEAEPPVHPVHHVQPSSQQLVSFHQPSAHQPTVHQPAVQQPALKPLDSLPKNAGLDPHVFGNYPSIARSAHCATPINMVAKAIRPPPGLSYPVNTVSGPVSFDDQLFEYESRLSSLRSEVVQSPSASPVVQDGNKFFAKQFLLAHVQARVGPYAQKENLSTVHQSPWYVSDASLPSAPPGLGAQRFDSRLWAFDDTAPNQEKISEGEETQCRDFHCTMMHRSPRPFRKKAEAKAQAKARREAIIADAWGGPADSKVKDSPANPIKESNTVKADSASLKKQRTAEQQSRQIKTVFHLLNPVLTAAESYPGPLELEFQLGLVLIPALRTTSISKEDMMTLKAMQRFFLPRNGLPPPTSTFFNRLTTSPAEVDYIIDAVVGGRRIFERSLADCHVQYEFHCQMERGDQVTIMVSDQGESALGKPAAALGSVHLSFPGHNWDAAVVLKAPVEHLPGSDPALEEAAHYIVSNLWVEPDRSLLRLHTRLPKNQLTVNKVFMKRWSRHRHVCAEGEATDNDLFLQITEVQDLHVSFQTENRDIMVALCSPLPAMVEADRQWWEMSLVSQVINALLNSNDILEPGQRTEDWSSHELLGRDAFLIRQSSVKAPDECKTPAELSTSSAIANAIGNAGLGDLFRLTATVVSHIDAVGYRNNGPGVTAAQNAGLDVGSSEVATNNLAVVSSGHHAEHAKNSELAFASSKVAIVPLKKDSAPSQEEVFEFW